MPRKLDPKELAMGIKVEKEHADTIAWVRAHPGAKLEQVAAQIAADHLRELPNYYTLLRAMERQGKKGNPPTLQQLLQVAEAAEQGVQHNPKLYEMSGPDRAMMHAQELAEEIRSAGGLVRVKAWSKPGVGARVYWPGNIGFLSIGQDGSVREVVRGKRVFDAGALYPKWRAAWKAGYKAYLEKLEQRLEAEDDD